MTTASIVLAWVSLVSLTVVGFRIMTLMTMSPLFRSRIWPWLRSRGWWPAPAERAAEALLRRLLTVTQYEALGRNGYLEVASKDYPGRTYRIPRGPGQVQVVERGHVMERLCLQPAAMGLPEADLVLMHKLLLESDEQRYLMTANHFPRAIWY
jgi:hypothetical protein